MQLTVDNISKSYGQKKVLSELKFTLGTGVYGLIGPNGAGKTTLMNIITGNLRPDAGRVLYDGQEVTGMDVRFREILGYMPQQQALYPDFTAERFLYYIASLRGLSRREAGRQINWAVEQVDLTEHIRKRIGAMSGGMKQRLLIAQAILADPKLLVLDEPTAGLDPNQRIAVRNLIGRLAGEKIIIISTHVVPDVEYIANQFLILRGGVLLTQSDRKELTDNLEGKVFEIEVPTVDVDMILDRYLVSSVIQDGKTAHLRVISEEILPYPGTIQRPGLDDACLRYFGDKL